MSEGPWFSAPCELLSAPAAIVGRASADPRRARRPPALLPAVAPQEVVVKKAKATSKTEGLNGGLLLPDRALDLPGTVHLRHGRYLTGGRVIAVPQLVQDWDEELRDEKNEVLVVELSAPGGAWFEDAEVSLVRVQTEDGDRLLPIGPLRDRIRGKVNLFARPVASLRKLDVPCRLPRLPTHVVALVSLCDLSDMLKEAEAA
jgi:hypothetical protein